MNAKQLLKVLKYSSPRIIYVVNFENKLKALRCPFKVRVLKSVHNLQQGQVLHVVRVWNTDKLDTVFEINGEYYQYHYFDFII